MVEIRDEMTTHKHNFKVFFVPFYALFNPRSILSYYCICIEYQITWRSTMPDKGKSKSNSTAKGKSAAASKSKNDTKNAKNTKKK